MTQLRSHYPRTQANSKKVIVDIETDGLDPTVIWCIVTSELDSGEVNTWVGDELELFKLYAETVDLWVAHNGISFDIPVINRLLGLSIPIHSVLDTFVISRLINYSRFNTHGLEELGAHLRFLKGEFNDWSKFSQEMLDYCIQDVRVTQKVYDMYRKQVQNPDWADSIECEHDIAIICQDMHNNGFCFDKRMAIDVLIDVRARMDRLEKKFQEVWPPELKECNRIQYRIKKDGSLFSSVERAMSVYPKTEIVGNELVCYDYSQFNPGSSKDRVEKLWEAGWEPFEKSDTHYKFTLKAGVGEPWGSTKSLSEYEYTAKKEYFDHYGWKVNEANLQTLPEGAPEGASALAEWLTLNGRKTALEERLRCLSDDGRIHTKFWHIGAWTQRMSHSNPNLANISSPFHGEPKGPVQQVKADYDAQMREMFYVDEGYLVGVDAESIQLRILAHYLKNDEYVHAIVSGRKEDETDIHNLNRRALGLNHLTRDHAKTFIYAWLLGAAAAKVSRILGCNLAAAKAAVSNFIERTHGLGELRSGQIKQDARRGWFEGLDGRKVLNDSEYLMLAGYLQNGEAVVMKHSNILWRQWADEEHIVYKQVNFVHDEWQTQVYGSLDMAERLKELQCKSFEVIGERLELYCPLAGAGSIGKNWLETH